jgi:hypothetical protein
MSTAEKWIIGLSVSGKAGSFPSAAPGWKELE